MGTFPIGGETAEAALAMGRIGVGLGIEGSEMSDVVRTQGGSEIGDVGVERITGGGVESKKSKSNAIGDMDPVIGRLRFQKSSSIEFNSPRAALSAKSPVCDPWPSSTLLSLAAPPATPYAFCPKVTSLRPIE